MSAPAAAGTPEHATGIDPRFITFGGVMAAMFLAALDQTIVGTAMPAIARDLNGLDRYTWVTTAYLLTSTAILPIVGKVSGQLGRKRFFLAAIVAFLAGSALCGAAPSLTWLIVFRGVQGIGAGALTGTAFVIIADLFSPAERGRYMGMMTGVFALASIVGPLVGGGLTDHVGWRWVFYVNLPVGAAVLAALWLTFPSGVRPAARPRIDWLGAVLIGGGAALVTYGASLQGTDGWGSPLVGASLALGVLLLVAGILHERREPEAVFPPVLFRSSIFSVAMAVMFLVGATMFGTIVYIPLFLQGVVGVQATNSGLLLLPLMAGMVVASIAGGQVMSRTGRYKLQGIAGAAFQCAGILVATRLDASSPQSAVTPAMVLIGLGMGLAMPVFTTVAQNGVAPSLMGPATSAVQFTRQIGSTLGLAIFGSYFNSRLAAHAGEGRRLALASSIHDVFIASAIVAAVTIVVSAFLREIPLRRSTGVAEQAGTGSPVAAPAAAVTPVATK